MKRRLPILIISFSLCAGPIWGKSSDGGVTAAFLGTSANARALGMGNAMGAVAGEITAFRLNPAVLGVPARSEILLGRAALFEDAALSEFSFGHAFERPLGLGFSLVHYGLTGITQFNPYNVEMAVTQDTKSSFQMGIGYQPWKRVSIGAAPKFIVRKVGESNSASAFDLDVGGLMIAGPLSVGAAVQNLRTAELERDGGNDELPLSFRSGAAYRWAALLASLDVVTIQSIDPRVHAGVEYSFGSRAAIRAGWDASSPVIGGSLGWNGISVDYGFLRNSPLGNSHRISLRFAFGPSLGTKIDARKEWRTAHPIIPKIRVVPSRLPQPMAPDKYNIAVAELEGRDVLATEAAVVSDLVRGEFVRSGKFSVVDRRNMEAILKEQAFQSSGCTAECAVEIGKILNVHIMVVGSLTRIGKTYIINLSSIDVETGKIIATDSIETKSQDKFAFSSRELARRIITRIIE